MVNSKNQRRVQEDKIKPECRRLLTAAVRFLRRRNFAECQKYAVHAKNSDPNRPDPAQILAIASVLICPKITPTLPDFYAVLNIPKFESDIARIRSAFTTLTSMLNPNVNSYPLSSEAFDLVNRAWSILANPVEKVRFDEEMRMILGGCTSGNSGGTFWTICPYCYYVYEYAKVYEECCLRCANGRCRRAFQAVAIAVPPPPEVAEKGVYLCSGFRPLGFGETNGGENVEDLWVPFAAQMEFPSEGCNVKDDFYGDGFIIDVSDDNKAASVEEGQRVEFQESKIKGETDNVGKCKNVNGEKTENIGETNSGFMKNDVKVRAERRKKCVPVNSKKLTGRGVRITMDQTLPTHGVDEEVHLNVDGNNDNEHVFGGEWNNDITCEVDFFEGIDDILVGLQRDYDLGNEHP